MRVRPCLVVYAHVLRPTASEHRQIARVRCLRLTHHDAVKMHVRCHSYAAIWPSHARLPLALAGSLSGHSKSRCHFDSLLKLGILGRPVLLRHVNIRLDADSFQQTFRRSVPGSARNPHEEVIANRFRVAADHLAGRLGTD